MAPVFEMATTLSYGVQPSSTEGRTLYIGMSLSKLIISVLCIGPVLFEMSQPGTGMSQEGKDILKNLGQLTNPI